jgi:hypothetical protein
MTKRQEINRMIYKIASDLRCLDPNYGGEAVISTLAKFYFEHPDYHSAYEAAANDYKIWDEARRPKGDGQGLLFAEEGVIPTGRFKGARVFMKDAKREDLMGWKAIETAAFESRSIDYAQKIQYIDSRVNAWNPDKHKTLLDLERDLFGHP